MERSRSIGLTELTTFRNHFEDYKEQYVLIGGSATKLLLEEADLLARSTKDMDLVLCAKALTREFVEHFWKFIHSGQYKITRNSIDKGIFYRFDEPGVVGYPSMIELLSERAELFESIAQTTLPLVVDDTIVSLSAIVLDKEYYDFLMENRRELNGIIIADEHVIIPLKITAYLDLTNKRNAGIKVRGDDIKKHRNDVLRLTLLLTNETMKNVPDKIKADIEIFIDHLKDENDYLRTLKIGATDIEEIKMTLRMVYGI